MSDDTVNLGPFAPHAGVWEGDKGKDQSPEDDRVSIEHNVFRERIVLEPIGLVEHTEGHAGHPKTQQFQAVTEQPARFATNAPILGGLAACSCRRSMCVRARAAMLQITQVDRQTLVIARVLGALRVPSVGRRIRGLREG